MIITRIASTLFVLLFALSTHCYAFEDKIPYGNNNQAGKAANINGIKIYYEVYGNGEPLLLIHGNGQNISEMHNQIKYFAAKNKVIVVDSRGHGKSGLGKGRLTYLQMMEDYNSLLENLNVKNVKVIGWSDGGIQALLLAIHHPDKVGKMALMGANLQPGPEAVSGWVFPLLKPLQETFDQMVESGDTSDDWNHHKQLIDLLFTQPNISIDSIRKINVPVLVMAGDKDIIRGTHTLEIFNNLPKAHLAILPGQTHWAPATDPETFNSLVDKFFSTPYTRPTSKEILTAAVSPPES
ncbi:MAG: alpha/beta hydrolase [Gammaproteobacteria bacterium]|nr:alpha/beta hydrolase [Gammaproteobacteria bacterium]